MLHVKLKFRIQFISNVEVQIDFAQNTLTWIDLLSMLVTT